MQDLTRLKSGDLVSVISPSSDGAGRFPHVFELGLSRLQKVFGLRTKEYQATRKLNASFKERAADIEAAFCDPETRAVFAAIGGFDQMLVLKCVDQELLRDNPKPFFGYSDNTSLHLKLLRLGIPSYYGGNVMNQFAWPPEMLELSKKFARFAFFESGARRLEVSSVFNEVDIPWDDENFAQKVKTFDASPPWVWDGSGSGNGILWGGCLEVICNHLMCEAEIVPAGILPSSILALETSEEVPSPFQCWSTLVAMGERGILEKVSAVLVARAKAWYFDRRLTENERVEYRKRHADQILRAVRLYNPDAPVVFNLDFGHTEPQIILPFGRRCTVNADEKWVEVVY